MPKGWYNSMVTGTTDTYESYEFGSRIYIDGVYKLHILSSFSDKKKPHGDPPLL
jgi:hypothetical protein